MIHNEADLRKWLVATIEDAGGHASSVESHATSAGIPDVDFCWDGTEGHIELKMWTKKNNKGLRPSQVRWFRKRIETGGRPCIAAMTQKGTFILVPGIRYQELKGNVSIQTQQALEQEAKWKWDTGLPQAQELKTALNDLIKGSQS